ncbi:MAG: SDR family NAD(P)-dependent oxidoreductase [Bacteroidetes bacterium]|nr:SDR family NAD(P)-dependent oxidoreductase [Bacteroidota bacterium]
MQYWFITGSSKGLGKALSELLLKENNNVVYGISRTNTIEHPNFHFLKTDLSDTQQLILFQFPDLIIPEKLNPELIVLINNAATLGDVKYTGDLENAIIINAQTLNTIAPHVLMNEFIKKYHDNNAVLKVIINITSGAASSPYDGWSIYGSGKAAMDMMTQIAAIETELRKQNFKIVAIAPGVMDTEMQNQVRSTEQDHFSRIDKFQNLYAENKLVSPETVAKKLIDLILNPYLLTETISRL